MAQPQKQKSNWVLSTTTLCLLRSGCILPAPKLIPPSVMVDFLALPPACAHSTFRCTASPHRPLRVAYPTFWIPVGLVLTSRALPFVSVRLDSLCTSTSPFPPDTPDYSARAHFLSTQERALSIPTRLYASYMSPFYYSLYITDPLLSSFILSTDPLPRVIKRDEPKGSIPLAHFISDFLIVHSVCAPSFKDSI